MVGCLPTPSLGCASLAAPRPSTYVDQLVAYMAQYSSVNQLAHGINPSLGNVFDGVVHFTKQIPPDSVLPSFIDLVYAAATLPNVSSSSLINTATAASGVAH
jgi:hypothetical protein